ncbi:MAG TPA: acyl-CoA thioesterase [Chloroflexus aurantiacus]|jgi:acyl-CoA thioester hydrolase|uniref:Thioesterase superfamily protein n=1 Tax=Chloroflexus aurantiacus (strain ATCC 29366 / DSM 635 / J-10-fl) TaxID=324602 RepID=A9WFM6_CHLAA|nr:MULTISPECIES: thioesterase family protein [Chloroflexus]ABY33964.1 thioesterase superfamily protein [Chloroflexus aurantiacus J-10-fl]GIV93809.1 MAG: thioesterase [Chloroflexus sp.]HBW68862.1 acyl-CoA thioesterase [Chloroflexus aurantiacus]
MNLSVPAVLAEYPFHYRIEVRFRDLDALGHVNNAVYATYFESARIAYYQRLVGGSLDRLGIILAELTISYKAPAHFGDELLVGVRVSRIGGKSFTMDYAIARVGDGALIATGQSVLVAYDYAAGRSVPVSDEFRARVAEFQGEVG